MKRMIGAGVVAGLALVGAALAKENLNPHWLSESEVAAIVAGEPLPPPAGSDAEKDDLKEEIEAQKTRTPARIAEAKLDANYSVTLFTNLLGPKITPQADPVTFHFFAELNSQIGEVVGASKDRFKKPRPYLTYPQVIHPLFEAGGWSYPSGHATHSYAFAEVLAAMFPEKAEALRARAEAIAESRVDAGVHYTSDIREGKVVGHEIVKELMAKPDFQAAMKAAENEVRGQGKA